MLKTITLCVLALIGTAAFADEKAADVCAKPLTGDAKLIYVAMKPKIAPGVDLKEVVKAQVIEMVKAGQVQQDTARQNAMAAGKCLQKLQ